MPEPLRILHAPLNIANDDWGVREAEAMLGCDSELAVIAAPSFGARFDVDLRFSNHGPLGRQLRKSAAAFRLIRDHDVINYSFGRSIVDYAYPFELLDMRLAHRLGKTVVATFHGCDVRPLLSGGCDLCLAKCDVQTARRRVEAIERNADLLYVKTPDILPAVPCARYIPQAVSGVSTLPFLPSAGAGLFVIVHAPSDREVKGTTDIIKAVEAVRSRGHEIELVLVENMPHLDALAVYARADLAIDQLRVGWYGVFAVEAMAMGKPVICRIDKEALALSGIDALPIINADANTLADTIERLIVDRGRLASLGEAGRRFATRWHDPLRIAAELLDDYHRVLAARRFRRPKVHR